MSKSISPVIILGGAAAAYFLLNNNSASAPAASSVVSNLQNLFTPSTTSQTLTGINSGILGGNGSFYTCSNYAQLAAADPNLLNPNYQLTPDQAQQYYNNYADLEQWYSQPSTAAQFHTVQNAMQYHWNKYGCAEKRIYYPFNNPSTAAYIAPPPAAKSSGSGILGTILKVATIVAGGVVTVASAGTAAPLVAAGTNALLTVENAAIHGPDTQLNDQEIALLMQAGLIIFQILPLYASREPELTQEISNKLTNILENHS